ncbi:hypothetical protein [Herbaspirillum camelliae]|uniref:hypothetical protein n=1 Tax=Herbaspirillum camelliae TaxID=1892903 RepID=UPI00117A79A2|nr:hypothetical protein [Herbaspirillum camelliae]
MSESEKKLSRLLYLPGSNLAPTADLLRSLLKTQRMTTVAQSFLDQSIIGLKEDVQYEKKLTKRLLAGNISPQAQAIEQNRLQVIEDKTAKNEGREPRKIDVPIGTNYLTPSEALAFVEKYDVTQKPNDSTGFSATLITEKPPLNAGPDFKREIIVSLRDTEFRPNSLGGGATQDVAGADFKETVGHGAALGQIAEADKWFRDQVIPKLEGCEKVTLASGSLSGQIAQSLEMLYPEHINLSANNNISFNATNLPALRDPAGKMSPSQILREAIDTYTAYRDNPLLAKSWLPQNGTYEVGEEQRVHAKIDRAAASADINPSSSTASGNYYESERLDIAWMAVKEKFEAMGMRPSILNNPFRGDLVERPGSLSVITMAMAGADVTMVPGIGVGNGNALVLPIHGQNGAVLGGPYTDIGNNHAFYTLTRPVSLMQVIQEQRQENGEPLMTLGEFAVMAERSGVEMADIVVRDPNAVKAIEGDSFPNLLDFIRESFVPAGSSFTRTVSDNRPYGEAGLDARLSWDAGVKELRAQMQGVVDAGGSVKMLDIASLQSEQRVALALEDSPRGDAVRFALKQASPVAMVVADREGRSLVPQNVRGSTALERDGDGNVARKFEQDIRSVENRYALIIDAREKNLDVKGARYEAPQVSNAASPSESPVPRPAAAALSSRGEAGAAAASTPDGAQVLARGSMPAVLGEVSALPGRHPLEAKSAAVLSGRGRLGNEAVVADRSMEGQEKLQFQLTSSGLQCGDDQRIALAQQLVRFGLSGVDLHTLSDDSVAVANIKGTTVGHLHKKSDGSIRYMDSNENGFEVGSDGSAKIVLKAYSETESQQHENSSTLHRGRRH